MRACACMRVFTVKNGRITRGSLCKLSSSQPLPSFYSHTHTHTYIYMYIIIYKYILCGPADDPGILVNLWCFEPVSHTHTHTHSFSVAGFWVSSPYSIALNYLLLRGRTSGTLYTGSQWCAWLSCSHWCPDWMTTLFNPTHIFVYSHTQVT